MTRRKPSEYNWATVEVDETFLPSEPRRIHHPRRQPIEFVVVHHMAMVGKGDGSANDACMRTWRTREASAHYGVDGIYVRQFVSDGDEAWATANSQGNQAGISIEHANSNTAPLWKVSSDTWHTGAKLAAALHVLYKLGRPVDGVTRNHAVVSGSLFKHSDFYSTACCGPYLGGKIWAAYVQEAQRQYDLMVKGSPAPTDPPKDPPAKQQTYKVAKGDTLTAIGRKFDVTVPQLKNWNGLANANLIKVGQILKVSAP